MYLSFLSGLARGLGLAIGFAVLGAVAVYFMQRLVSLRLPAIGQAIAQLIRMVQQNMVR